MAFGVGITRIVVLGRYPEDVTELLKETNIQMTQLDHSSLKKWITQINQDPEFSKTPSNQV